MRLRSICFNQKDQGNSPTSKALCHGDRRGARRESTIEDKGSKIALPATIRPSTLCPHTLYLQPSILGPLYVNRCKVRFRASSRRILQISVIVARPTMLLQDVDELRPSNHRRR